jgi:YkoP domain
LFARLSTPRAVAHSAWLESAIFGLDRWLRRRQGVYEYSSDPACLFRIQRARADRALSLSDGTCIDAGDPILNLHLWNEHMPAMTPEGATMAWARQVSRALGTSLGELAQYLAQSPELDDIAVLRADMRLGTAEKSAQLARIMAHYGFESADCEIESAGLLHRFGENIFIFLLVLATNPATVRAPILWRARKQVYLSRAALERRHGSTAAGDGRMRSMRAC